MTYDVNGVTNATFYSKLPSVIVDTRVVSSLGSEDKNRAEGNFVSTDKLYLLSPEEVYGTSFTNSYDTSIGTSRQLEWYSTNGVTTSNYSGAIKKNSSNSVSYWWLRSVFSSYISDFYGVYDDGRYNDFGAYITHGVSPAFRLG